MMMKNWKRAISFLLCMAMLLGNFPVVSFAAETDGLCPHHEVHGECGYVEGESACGYLCELCAQATEETTEPPATETEPVCTGLADCAAENHSEGCENKLADAAIMVVDEGTLEASGTCGENLRWEFHYVPREDSSIGDNVLYITGTGDMTDFDSPYDVPWPRGALDGLAEIHISEGVTSIGNHAFYANCPSEIVLPDSITRIGNYAFAFVNILDRISLSANLESIGEGAFKDCWNLSNLAFPDTLKSIGVDAFNGCDALEHINIPDSVTEIGIGAFGFCDRLTSVRLPASLTQIAESLFSHCYSLSSVNIPAQVTNIGTYAFNYCTGLNSIQFPSGLLSIEDYAFSNLDDLVISYWPLSLTTIGSRAFDSGVTDVYYEGNEEDRAKIDDGSDYYLPVHAATWHYGTPDPDYHTNLGNGIQVQVVNGSDVLTVYGGKGQVTTHILLTYEDGNSSTPVASCEVDFVVTNTATNTETTWGPLSTDENGIVSIPLSPMSVPFEENVSLALQFSRVGEDEVNSEYTIPITVTVTSHTPLEQSWELSKAEAGKLSAGWGQKLEISDIEFQANALQMGVSLGSGAGMGISHSVNEHGQREISMSGQVKASFASEIGSGIKASYDGLGKPAEIEGSIVAVNASVEQETFKNYSMKISNYDPADNEHQRAIALFSLNQFYTMFSQNPLLFQLTNRINMKSSHEDIHYEVGTGKTAASELEAEAGSLSWLGKTIISDSSASVKVISESENTIDNSGNTTQ